MTSNSFEPPLISSDLAPESTASSGNFIDRLRQLFASRVTETVTLSLAVSLGLVGISSWNVWTVYRDFQNAVAKEMRMQKLGNDLRYFDEVLTMSANMAATTGDPKWITRYNLYDPSLTKTFDELLQSKPEIKIDLGPALSANVKLVELERETFKLVQEWKKTQAQGILFGPDYSSLKRTYTEGTEKALNKLEKQGQQEVAAFRQKLYFSLLLAIATLPVIFLTWVAIQAAVSSYIIERRRSQAQLLASQASLQQLNQDLEKRVEERTQKILEQEEILRAESEALQDDVGNLLEAVSAVEEGDLTVQAPVSDRVTGLVSDTLNRLIEELAAVMAQVLSAAQNVFGSSQNLELIAGTVSHNASQQADSVAQALTLSGEVEKSAETTVQELEYSREVLLSLLQTVDGGREAIVTLTEGTGVLQQGTDRMIQQMKTLGEFVGLAEQFVQDQNQIATQTQILALNASLVAARAAEQQDPRKFAAAAQEFESIADRVSQLAQQTNEGLIALEQRTAQIQSVVASVDAEVQNLGSLVNGFARGVEESDRAFNSVQSVTTSVVRTGEQVAQSSQDIIDRAQSTASAMEAIVVLAQKTANLTLDAREQSELMGQLSAQLLERIEFFRLPASETLPADAA
jgi:methyl-accepting chemotaxis protein PixJ